MTTDTETMQAFIDRNQLEMSNTRIPARTDLDDEAWSKDARHWVCVLRQVGFNNPRTMTVNFSQGSAHKKPPTLADVLDCLAMDAMSYDNSHSFEDWCSDFGYDSDSRKAERTYRICGEQAKALRHFLGNDEYRHLLENVERL